MYIYIYRILETFYSNEIGQCYKISNSSIIEQEIIYKDSVCSTL